MTDELPPLITDPADWHRGYIYVVRWEDFQHRDALRSGPPMKWIKLHTALLDNPEYLDLTPAYRGLLVDLWLLTARMGNGRVSARGDLLARWLGYDQRRIARAFAEPPQRHGRVTAESRQSHGTDPAEPSRGHLQRGLKRLNHAGFIVVRAGRNPAAFQQTSSTEERREGGAPTAHTPTSKRTRARAGAAKGAPATNGQGTPYNIDPDTVKAIQAGYEPGWLTDDQIAAVRGEETI
jgi:hypothetical protein